MRGAIRGWWERLAQRVCNERGEASVSTPEQELAQLRAQLDKAQKDNATLGYRVRNAEKVFKDLGQAVEYDAQGNPVRVVMPEATPNYGGTGGSWMDDPDGWFTQKANSMGFLTQKQFQDGVSAATQQAIQAANANTHLFLGMRDLLAQEDYKSLSDYASPLSKRTAEILQERRIGAPLEGAKHWRQWNYADLDSLQFAADRAMIDLAKQAKATEASTAAAQSAQQAAGLSAGTGGAAEGTGKVDISKMDPDQLYDQMDKDVEANAVKAGLIRP